MIKLDDDVLTEILFPWTVQNFLPKFLPSGGLVAWQSKSGVASEVILQIPLDSRRHATAGKHYLQVLYRTHAAEC